MVSGADSLSPPLRETGRQLYDSLALKSSLPSFTDYSIEQDFIEVLLGTLQEYKPSLVVELGSGISTVILGSWAKRENREVLILSVEHQERYLKQTENWLRQRELQKWVQLMHCPLAPHFLKERSWQWYDIPFHTLPGTIDMLVVDGPPGSVQPEARYPALPLLAPYFADRAVVLMDDAYRADERRILARWREEFPHLACDMMSTRKGCALLRS